MPSAPTLAMGPDWAVRLAAGQVGAVHADAVRRLRQAGWDAVPALETPAEDGHRGAWPQRSCHAALAARADDLGPIKIDGPSSTSRTSD